MTMEAPSIQEIYSALSTDEGRNKMTIQDVLDVLVEKRSPVLLTERKEHLDIFRIGNGLMWCKARSNQRKHSR